MKRHQHSLSHYNLTTCDMGELVPIGCVEVLPGDSFAHQTSALIRSLPLVLPVMHPIQVRIHHWFVPNRLVWDGWESFITDPNDVSLPPTIATTTDTGKLEDYFGLPRVTGHQVCALPFRAYNKIFNEFYRDQDLVTEVDEDSTALQNVAWAKDYFTGARPWTQKGPDVTIPIGERAPVYGVGMDSASSFNATNEAVRETGGVDRTYLNASSSSNDTHVFQFEEDPDNPTYPNIWADLSSAEGVDVNELRRAFAIQRYQEARSRFGSRYSEYLRYLGVRPSDARLQRPEYLGGGKQLISFSEILQTAEPFDGNASLDSSLGKMGGHGIASMRTRRYRRFFEEHGYVLSLLSCRPRSIYSQGIHRSWSRKTKEDYWQKELEHIGQQEVYQKELHGAAADEVVFGYSDRYREYREQPSYITGEMRVDEALDSFHFARKFETGPALNEDFIKCVPTKRPHAVETNDVLWLMINHSIRAKRLVSRNAGGKIL